LTPLNIGLVGLGTVGRGVADILGRGAADIERRAGRPLRVHAALVRDAGRATAWRDERGHRFEILTDADALLDDPDIDIVCELAGGEEPALGWTRRALAGGKHVVTANKALIATHGESLFALAQEHGVSLRFEAAIAGGIPIVKALSEGLAGNRIEWLAGIINGTGNYILSEMTSHGREFADALGDAQALGYAEADPTFDVEGIDAAHKLAILASIAFGAPLEFDGVMTEGISAIERADVAFAAELGYRIKHLGVARRRAEGLELRVHPTLVPAGRLLASVDGVMNAVVVHGDAVGSTLYYGAGAGSGPTGSSVVADLIDIARGSELVPRSPISAPAADNAPLGALAPDDFRSPFYLRLEADDRPGVMAAVAGIFGASDISIEAILQKEPTAAGDGPLTVPIILLTREVRERILREAVVAIEALQAVRTPVVTIRVETLG